MNTLVEDMNNLRHMLGIGSHVTRKNWGFRNYFDSGESDMPSMLRLEAAGLVERGSVGTVFHATKEGRAAVALDERQYQHHHKGSSRAKGPRFGAARLRSYQASERIMSDHNLGLYNKYHVKRTDGSSRAGKKHAACEYFVLDLTHDKHARVALLAYAASCRGEYPRLADDLRIKAILDPETAGYADIKGTQP